jgi:hypothetical protein
MAEERVRVLRHSLGTVQFMKFLLPPAATAQEIRAVFERVAMECLERGLRGALLVDNDRPAANEPELKAAVAVLDLPHCPPNFRLALVAFRKPAYRAYLSALATLPAGAKHTGLFWDELDAMQWLREQFPKSAAGAREAS